MTSEQYENLLNEKFTTQQINQISMMEQHGFDLDVILEFVDSNTNIELMRHFNEIYKKLSSIDDVDTEWMFNMLKQNIDPYLLFDDEYDYSFKSCLKDIISDMAKRDFVDREIYEKLIDNVKIYKNEEDFIFLINVISSILRRIDDADINLIFRSNFTPQQVEYADYLDRNDYKQLIPEIHKIKSPSNFCYNKSQIDSIIKHNMPFADICNSYEQDSIDFMIRGYERYKINVNDYLLNKPYSNNVLLCLELLRIDKIEPLNEGVLEKCLNLKWEYNWQDKPIWNSIIELENAGFDLNSYFSKFPDEFGIKLFETLIKEGCIENEIKRYIKLFEDNVGDFKRLEKFREEDIFAIINLYENYYDVSKVIENRLRKIDIDTILDISVKCDMDFEDLLFRDYLEYELDMLQICVENNRYDVAEALIHVNRPNQAAYENIIELMEHDISAGTHHKIINLLFDKGNDVFCSFEANYEFSEEQKEILSEGMLAEKINDETIDVIRFCNMDEGAMEMLIDLIGEGLDITEIVKQIDTLTSDDIETLAQCLRLGYKIVAPEKEQNIDK